MRQSLPCSDSASMLTGFIVVESLSTLDAQISLLYHLLQIIPRFLRNTGACLCIMVLNIPHNVQAHDIHLLTGSLGRFEDVLEDAIDLLRFADALGEREEGFPFDGRPDSEGVEVRQTLGCVAVSYLLYM